MKNQSSDGDTVYIVETPSEIFWSKRKMETQYRHMDFLWRDRAKYKELSEFRWAKLSSTTKKKVYEIVR
jgi:hypothetical protein